MKLNIFSKKKNNKPEKKDIEAGAVVKEENLTVISPGSFTGRSVLKHIYTSEKSTRLLGFNQYVFKVNPGANKNEVKKEVASRYNVKVKDVKVINVHGKRRDIGRYPGTRPGYRKAIVILEAGSVIAQAKP